jgi:hypothetical protein
MNTVIGISGVAGAGKDTFFDLLSQYAPCRKYSLANELKTELNQWCRMHYGIDSQACSREEKEIIRPLLVFHGSLKRQASKGRYWIERLNDNLIKDKFNGFKIITDIRYDEYEHDEVSWLKNELNGILIHVSQWSEEPDTYTNMLVKKFKAPANSEEAKNDPIIKEKSDFQIEWEFIKNGQISELKSHINDFVEWLACYEKTAGRQHINKEN